MTGEAQQAYSKGAIALHWLIALVLAGEIALGFAMPKDASGFALYQLHKSIGIVILLLTLVRIGWRLRFAPPPPVERGMGAMLAGAVHVGFYVFLLAMPLSGWALVSSAQIKVPTLVFGLVPWPHLPLPDSLGPATMLAHQWLAFAGLALFFAHVAGALRHHFLLHDGLLARMAPGARAPVALALAALVVILGAGVWLAVGQRAGAFAKADRQDILSPAPDEDRLAPMAAPADAPPQPLSDSPVAGDGEGALADGSGAALVGEPAGAPPSWRIQPGGSLRFRVDNAGAQLGGGFARWSGQIAMDPARPETASIVITVDLASASLGDATQDQMLTGPDFLGVAAHPQAIWRATSVRRAGNNAYLAEGTLSLKGASRPQSLGFTLEGSGNRRQVSGEATIDRNAFQVGAGPNAAGLGAQVRLSFAFEAAS